MATVNGGNSAAGVLNDDSHEPLDYVLKSQPPSHITPDGTYIFLPAPSTLERSRFFERAIASHGLLLQDTKQKRGNKKTSASDNEDGDDDSTVGSASTATPGGHQTDQKKKRQATVHPLTLASAALHSSGINELNRAINLNGLLTTNEYIGLTNVVDPSLEAVLPTPSASNKLSSSAVPVATSSSAPTDGTAENSTRASADGAGLAGDNLKITPLVIPEQEVELQESQRVKAMYVLKRKYQQFRNGERVLARHQQQLMAAIVTQSRPDSRLRHLRRQWSLVAPEHGTRSMPHAVRPTELIACDVDVYQLQGHHQDDGASSLIQTLGRLAKGVPRFATMEIKDDFPVPDEVRRWKKTVLDPILRKEPADADVVDLMDVDEVKNEHPSSDAVNANANSRDRGRNWTRAEPFAIADPTLGKLDSDFDPRSVVMLTLQFDIEKPSTGYRQSARMEASSSPTADYEDDERVLVALQHSLFCAKLFESIRRELAPDTEGIGQVRTTAQKQSVVWLSSARTNENFLPPPSLLAHDRGGTSTTSATYSGLSQPLAVIHCHEGEVKVQLDCEYNLRVRLVEASNSDHPVGEEAVGEVTPARSGTQSPERLLALCRTLLWHAQLAYHRHSIEISALERQRIQEKADQEMNDANDTNKFQGHAVRRRDPSSEGLQVSPRILQSCVSLGTKMLFEHRIRRVLRNLQDWIIVKQQEQSRLAHARSSQSMNGGDSNGNDVKEGSLLLLEVEWLPLSIFDFHAQFTIRFGTWTADIHLERDQLTVSQFCEPIVQEDDTVKELGSDNSQPLSYRKVHFHSDGEFSLFLRMALQRELRRQSRQ
jgi:hypothetical protein